jgi:3-methyl-2-oxobutanoate hydroxymethyltransferase
MNAGRLVQQGGAESVKMEGGQEIAADISAITRAGIPVMGHLGLIPQSVHKLGGYRVQGRDEASATRLLEDALAVQEAGAYALVVEAMDPDIAAEITSRLEIPTIGIGAGRRCDGQVLVLSDLIGMLPGKSPRFVKRYAEVGETMTSAVASFCAEVQAGVFPEEKHEY